MKIILLLSLCIVGSLATQEPKVGRVSLYKESNRRIDLYQFWKHFKKAFQKEYESAEEEMQRMENFFKSYATVKKHNAEFQEGKHKYSMKVNEYSDMSNEEVQKVMNGYKMRDSLLGDGIKRQDGSTFLVPNHFTAPRNVDWRKHGYVTHVKNQTGALEGQHFRKSGKLVSLSEQNLVDCSKRFGNNGCEGGLMDDAFRYVKANGGIDTEASYPYEAVDDTCRFNATDIGATDTGFVDVPKDEDSLKAAVASVGPVSVAIDASHYSFQLYSQGVYYEPECSSEQLDHGVLVVGYGTTEDGDDYWLVKNSWGTTWGENGYIKMARNKHNNCGIATQASYPLV